MAGLALTMAATAILGFYRLGDKSLWVDEALTWEFTRSWSRLMEVFSSQEINMGLFFLAVRGWTTLFGESEFALRSFSVFAAVGTIPVVFWLGRRLFGVFAGLTAAALLAVNPYFLAAAQEARGYALLAFLASLAMALFLNALDHRTLPAWFGYTLAAVLAVYVHYFAALIVLVQSLYLFLLPRAERPLRFLVLSAGLGALLLVPLTMLQLRLGSGQSDWIPKPALLDLAVLLERFAGGRIALAAAAAIAAIGFLRMVRRQTVIPRPVRRPWLLTAIWLILPVAIAFLFSVCVKPIWGLRYLIVAFPGYALLLAATIRAWPLRARGRVLVVAVLLVAQAAALPTLYRTERQSWKQAVGWMADHGRPGDGVYFSPAWIRAAYLYTARRHYPEAPAPIRLRDDREETDPATVWTRINANKARRTSRQYGRIWVVTLPGGHTDDLAEAIRHIAPYYPARKKHIVNAIHILLMARPDPAQEQAPGIKDF